MTLADLVSFVCTTVNQTEASDIAACKMYFKLRHQMLWQLALWKDSLISYTATIATGNYNPVSSAWLPTRQILQVAPIITHVVSARTADRKLSVQSQEWFYCRDIDSFMNQGTVLDYVTLPPAVWDFDTAVDVGSWCTAAADAGSPTSAVTIGADGFTETENNIVLSIAGQDLGSLLTIESFSKGVTTGPVQIGQFTPAPFSFTLTYKGGSFPLHVAANSTNLADAIANYGPSGGTLTIPVSAGDVLHFWVDTSLSPNTYTVGLAGELLVDATVNFLFNPTADVSQTSIVSMQAADTVSPRRQRIQLVGSVASNTVLRILGKRTCPRLTNDNDEPAITGSEICLIPAVHADMLKRERQYGKAVTMATQEFGPTLDALKKEQTAQQSFKKRLVPVDGFSGGNAYPFADGSPLSF